MELSIQKWGNSAAVRLPSTLLARLGVDVGDKLRADMTPDGLVLRVVRKRYALADLMAQCDLTTPSPVDMAQWDSARAAGNEER